MDGWNWGGVACGRFSFGADFLSLSLGIWRPILSFMVGLRTILRYILMMLSLSFGTLLSVCLSGIPRCLSSDYAERKQLPSFLSLPLPSQFRSFFFLSSQLCVFVTVEPYTTPRDIESARVLNHCLFIFLVLSLPLNSSCICFLF